MLRAIRFRIEYSARLSFLLLTQRNIADKSIKNFGKNPNGYVKNLKVLGNIWSNLYSQENLGV